MLAQTIAQEVNHVIDARLVGAGLAILVMLVIPMVRWLGGMAVAAAFEKITGVKAEVQVIRDQYEVARVRQDDHGRKLALTTANSEHAYNKATVAQQGFLDLSLKTVQLTAVAVDAKALAEEALEKAIEVDGGLAALSAEHGKLEVRVERTERDIERTNERVEKHIDKDKD